MNKLLMIAVVSLGLATSASATTFQGVTSGTFTGVVDGVNVDGSGPIAVWPDDNNGCIGFLCFFGIGAFTTGQSTLEIESFGFNQNVGDAGGTIKIGQLNWFNAASRIDPAFGFPGTDLQFTLNANLNLSFTNPVSLGPLTEAVAFDITNVENMAGDIVGSTAFSVGGIDFGGLPLAVGNRRITGFSFVLMNPNVTSSFDATTGVWNLAENSSASLALQANIAPIPLPAAGWMLLVGIGGLAAMRRRKQRAAA